MNKIILKIILFYRHYISPYKGYKCAHHHVHGDGSCSYWALGVIEKRGVFYFICNVRPRLVECQLAYEGLKEPKDEKSDDNENKQSDKCCIPVEIASCFLI